MIDINPSSTNNFQYNSTSSNNRKQTNSNVTMTDDDDINMRPSSPTHTAFVRDFANDHDGMNMITEIIL